MSTMDFRTLVNNYGRQVINTAVRITGDPQRAQDVHQEVFLAIWQRWHSYNGRTKWPAYLYRVTVRKALELQNRARRQSRSLRHCKPENHDSAPDRNLVAEELRSRLAESLAKLPRRQAEVFVLTRLERFKQTEVAEMLACSQNTVRVHLHRAIKRLASELGDQLVD